WCSVSASDGTRHLLSKMRWASARKCKCKCKRVRVCVCILLCSRCRSKSLHLQTDSESSSLKLVWWSFSIKPLQTSSSSSSSFSFQFLLLASSLQSAGTLHPSPHTPSPPILQSIFALVDSLQELLALSISSHLFPGSHKPF